MKFKITSLVSPRRHPLARARQLRVEDLAKEQFLIVPRSQVASVHDSIVQRCHAAGFAPTIALKVYLQQTILNFVAEGLGVAFVPASMRRSQIEGAVFKPVPDPLMIDQVLQKPVPDRVPLDMRTASANSIGRLIPSSLRPPKDLSTNHTSRPKLLR